MAFIITIEGTADVDLDGWFNYNVELVSDRGDIFEQLGIFSNSVLVLGDVQISIPSYRACTIPGYTVLPVVHTRVLFFAGKQKKSPKTSLTKILTSTKELS